MSRPGAGATVLALDLGGTQVRAALVRPDGSRVGRSASATPVAAGPAAIVEACIATLRRAREAAAREDAAAEQRLVGIGVSAPGPLNPWTGIAVEPANLGPDFPGTDVAGPIGAAFGYIGTATGSSFCDNNITPDFSKTPPLHRNPFARGQIVGDANGLLKLLVDPATRRLSDFALDYECARGAIGRDEVLARMRGLLAVMLASFVSVVPSVRSISTRLRIRSKPSASMASSR